MLLWARTGNGNRAFDLAQSLIRNNVMENLWDRHPPFQIDGNFGYTAGVSEMLLGGSDGTVIVLQALPGMWREGEFSGIVSRGGIAFDCSWSDGKITYLAAKAKRDVTVDILLPSGNILDCATSRISLQADKLTVLIERK
jgi:hypothetical protein